MHPARIPLVSTIMKYISVSLLILLAGFASAAETVPAPTTLSVETVERLSTPIDPDAERLALSAIARFQNIENLPTFRLNFALRKTETELAIPLTATCSSVKLRQVLQMKHALSDEYSWDEILSFLTDPKNPERSIRKFVVAGRTWMGRENPPYMRSSWDYWTGEDFVYGSIDADVKEILRYDDRFSGQNWWLAGLGLIDTLSSGERRLPMSSQHSGIFSEEAGRIPPAASRFRSAPDEKFCGTHCSVVDATDLPHRFYIDPKTGHLRGMATFNWQGRLVTPHWKVAHKRLGLSSPAFENVEDWQAWVKQLPASQQKLVWRDAGYFLNHDSSVDINPYSLIHFSDYVDLGEGVALPQLAESATVVATDRTNTQFEYRFHVHRMTGHSSTVKKADFDRFLPEEGFPVNDLRKQK